LGSRVMGGGFGGCTINLIKAIEIENIFAQLSKLYDAKFGIKLKMYSVTTGDGARILN
jgi:galactokinase